MHWRLATSLPEVQPYLECCKMLCEKGGVAGNRRPVVLGICIRRGEKRRGEEMEVDIDIRRIKLRSGQVRSGEVKSGERFDYN